MHATETVTSEVMTPEQLGQYLGIGRTKAYSLLSTGEIPSFYVGRLRRVRKKDCDAFMEKQLGAR